MSSNANVPAEQAVISAPPAPEPWRKIMAIVNPAAQHHPAVEKAVRLAAISGASLELYACEVEQDIPESWAGPQRARQYREFRRLQVLDELGRLAEEFRAWGVEISIASAWRAPLEEGIGHHVIRSNPDLVVKETPRHPDAGRVVLTRTDWTLMRQVHAPLLLVGPRQWSAAPRIAAAVDSSRTPDNPASLNDVLVEQARIVAGVLHGAVEIFHVLQTPPHLPGEAVSPQQRAAAHAWVCREVERLAQRADAAATRVAEGRIAEVLAGFVTDHAPDMLVVGAVARPRWVHSAANGTAAQLLERVACDLLVVKPPGFISPLLVTED